MKAILAIKTWFFVLVFLLFAFLQWNDPDPYIWMPVYLIYAAFGVASFYRKPGIHWYWIFALLALIFAVFQWPEKWEGFGESMLNQNMERAREAVGLCICVLACLVFIGNKKYLEKIRGYQNQ